MTAGRPGAGLGAGRQGVAARRARLTPRVGILTVAAAVVHAGSYVHAKAALRLFFYLEISGC